MDFYTYISDLQQHSATLQHQINILRNENVQLLQNQERNGDTTKENRPLKARKQKKNQKPYDELKHSARTDRRRKMEGLFKKAAEDLYPEITSVKVSMKFSNGKVMDFWPRAVEETEECQKLETRKKENSLETIHKVLTVKDRFRISDKAMHELHMIDNVCLPSINKITEERNRLNTVIPIHTFSGSKTDCCTRKVRDVLEYVLQLPIYKHYLDKEDNVRLKLRFASDGAKITKAMNSVRGVFKILHDRETLPTSIEEISMSPEDEHTIFFYLGDENRKSMMKYGKETFAEMKNIQENGVELNGKKVDIEWILTSDWKALALLKGINGANSDHFCIWCHCTKRQICDFSIPEWPITRSMDEQNTALTSHDLGYIAEDMCSFVKYENITPDDLHLRIRISLKLFNQVVTWAIDQESGNCLEKELERIGISFHFWEERAMNKDSASVKKWSQPSGDELKIIIKNTRLHNVLSHRQDKRYVSVESLSMIQLREELESRGLNRKGKKNVLIARLTDAIGDGSKIQKKKTNKGRLRVSYDFESDDDDDINSLNVDAIQELWQEFDELMEALRELPSSATYMTAEVFMKKAKAWAQNFRKYTFDEDVTPYIHALVYHVPYFLRKFRYLHDVGVAQVERKNYEHRLAYFGSTNRNGGKNKDKVSKQILQRENRMLWMKHEGMERKKRAYKRRGAASE